MTLGPGDDGTELGTVELRLVELLAEALALELRTEVGLLGKDGALPSNCDEEDPV